MQLSIFAAVIAHMLVGMPQGHVNSCYYHYCTVLWLLVRLGRITKLGLRIHVLYLYCKSISVGKLLYNTGIPKKIQVTEISFGQLYYKYVCIYAMLFQNPYRIVRIGFEENRWKRTSIVSFCLCEFICCMYVAIYWIYSFYKSHCSETSRPDFITIMKRTNGRLMEFGESKFGIFFVQMGYRWMSTILSTKILYFGVDWRRGQ